MIATISVIRVPVVIGPAARCHREGKRSQANGAAYDRRGRVPTIIPVVAPAVVVSVAIPAIVPIVMLLDCIGGVMTCELVTLIGPAQAAEVSASRAVPETIEILFVSITHPLCGYATPHCEGL
jgi:hypothetical protein